MLYSIKMLSLNIPKEIDIQLNKYCIEIKGPLGKIKKKISNTINLNYDCEKKIIYFNSKDLKINNFNLSILNKLIWGVWKGYKIKLQLVGVGYKAFLENNILSLKIGFSHQIQYNIPLDIKISILSQKGNFIVVSGNNLQKVNQTAFEIKKLKLPDAYKGKGIRYFKENIKLKEGKKTNV